MPELAFISLGSNIRPEEHLPLAIRRLAELGKIRSVSSVYQNPAIGPTSRADFLNAAALVKTDLPPEAIRLALRRIEADLGRVRTADPYEPRTIDVDLCLLGALVLNAADMTLPDPHILTRAYLAVTLAELQPDFQHPVTGESLRGIADRLRRTANLTLREDVTSAARQAIK